MSWILPVPPPQTDPYNPPTAAESWERAAPTVPNAPMIGPHEGKVSQQQQGPNANPDVRDNWMDPDIFVVGRQGVMNGRQLFDQIPIPPHEGHGGWEDIYNTGPKIDHSTRTLALFASDWNGIVQQQQMRGEHVTIQRVPPGSTQGYMPTDMTQPNNQRDVPAPWDASLTAGA